LFVIPFFFLMNSKASAFIFFKKRFCEGNHEQKRLCLMPNKRPIVDDLS
jgi:hypothetical protein